jgi:hypothetical protein
MLSWRQCCPDLFTFSEWASHQGRPVMLHLRPWLPLLSSAPPQLYGQIIEPFTTLHFLHQHRAILICSCGTEVSCLIISTAWCKPVIQMSINLTAGVFTLPDLPEEIVEASDPSRWEERRELLTSLLNHLACLITLPALFINLLN